MQIKINKKLVNTLKFYEGSVCIRGECYKFDISDNITCNKVRWVDVYWKYVAPKGVWEIEDEIIKTFKNAKNK